MRVRFWNEYVAEEMQPDFAELAARFFKNGGFNIDKIPCIANRRAFVTTKVAKVEKAVTSDSAAIREEPKGNCCVIWDC